MLEQLKLLAQASLPLVKVCEEGLSTAMRWISETNRHRSSFPWPRRRRTASCKEKLSSPIEEVVAHLQYTLNDFHAKRRDVAKPYRHVFDPAHGLTEEAGYRKVGVNVGAAAAHVSCITGGFSTTLSRNIIS